MTAGLAADPGALAWLRWLLAPDTDRAASDGGAAAPTSTATGEEYRVLPSGRRPRVVVPVAHPAATRAVLDGDLASSGPARRVTGLVSRLGRLPPGLGTSFTVPAGDDGAAPSLRARLADELATPDLQVGATVGGPRPNRKPVLKLVTPDGEVVAYAKVAWNPLTERLVENERAWLDRVAERRPDGLSAPSVWTALRWKSMSVLVTRPLPPPVAGAGRTNDERPFLADARLLTAIAALVPAADHDLVGSDWWDATGRRVAAVADPEVADRLRSARASLASRMAGAVWPFGAWHGDLTTWNARPVAGGVAVWDWERAAAPAPLGFDAAHAAFQQAQVGRRLDVGRSADACEAALAEAFPRLGLAPQVAPDIVTCYLVERFLRWDEDRRLGSTTATTGRHDAVLDAVTRRAARPGSGAP